MTQVVGAVVALLVLAQVVRQVVRGRIRVRYAALWLVVGAATALVAVVPGLLAGLADLLGFAVPANLLFFGGVAFLLAVGVSHSAAITSLEDRVQRLAEEVALLSEVRDADPTGSRRGHPGTGGAEVPGAGPRAER